MPLSACANSHVAWPDVFSHVAKAVVEVDQARKKFFVTLSSQIGNNAANQLAAIPQNTNATLISSPGAPAVLQEDPAGGSLKITLSDAILLSIVLAWRCRASQKNGRSHVLQSWSFSFTKDEHLKARVRSRRQILVLVKDHVPSRTEHSNRRDERMVPRLRHRVGIETLKRELQLVDGPAGSSSSSQSSSIAAVKKSRKNGADYLSVEGNCGQQDSTDYQSLAVGDNIPGFRASATFFSSLRTNLHLGVSPPPSPMSTPPSMRASASSIGPPPSPLQNAVDNTSDVPDAPLSSIPELSTYVAESEEDKIAALKLVADSVAQMRQIANRILMFNPLNLAVFFAFLAVVSNYLYKERSDIGIVITTCSGLTMAAMVSLRWITGPFVFAAEEINFSLLDHADVLVTKFGDEVMGTVVLGWVDGEVKAKKRKWRAEIRGWAVRLRYRGKGEGLRLLEEAVDLAKKKGADGVVFAPDHANSVRVLYDFYNGFFDKREKDARNKLQELWQASSKSKRR